MPEEPDFDVAAAHRFFSSTCFNMAWDFIDKPNLSPAEIDEMLQLAHVSAWHWAQRPDCTRSKQSVSYWQLSRVYALARDSQRARRNAALCLKASEGESPFLIAYAHEALARAAAIAGDHDEALAHVKQARESLVMIDDREEMELVRKDIDSIRF
jgi:hypothetical protein